MGHICVWSLSSQESRKLSCLLRMGAAATNIFHSRRMILASKHLVGIGNTAGSTLPNQTAGSQEQPSQQSRSFHFLQQGSGCGAVRENQIWSVCYDQDCLGADAVLILEQLNFRITCMMAFCLHRQTGSQSKVTQRKNNGIKIPCGCITCRVPHACWLLGVCLLGQENQQMESGPPGALVSQVLLYHLATRTFIQEKNEQPLKN